MREFSLQISDFTKGISSAPLDIRNTTFMHDLYNVRIGKYGLEPIPTISTLPEMPDIVWPLPQIIKTSIGVFVMSGTRIYEVNNAGVFRDVASGFVSTRQWDVADFGKYQVWTDGSLMIVRTYDDQYIWGTLTGAPDYYPYSVCNYRGQLIMGGLGSTYPDWVCWSNIGSVNMADMLDITKLGVDSDDMKNTAGNRKMPFSGQIYKVLPLDSAVVVYGENGMAALVPARSPSPTFGMKELPKMSCTRAVGGGLYKHIFIDADGYLWKIDDKLKVEKLGYNRLFAGKNGIVSYDESNDDFYISTDWNETYLFSSSEAMSRVDTVVTSIARMGDNLIAPHTDLGISYQMIVTDIIDFKSRGIKTITGVEIGASGDTYTAIEYRFDSDGAFRQSPWKTVYKNGMAFHLVSGVDFRIRVHYSGNADLSYINVRWKLVDKRMIRGLDVANDRNVSRADS